MSTGVATYYERLGQWNRIARAIGYGGGSESLTVHRALADPRAGGRPTFTRLHDVILEHLPAQAAPRVLDAGCGLGGTMLALAEALDANCFGLTLSPSQAATANAAARARGMASSVHAEVRSYDAPPAGPFDLVIAVESIAHSPDPARTIDALTTVVAPGGCVVVVDDMPEPGLGASADLATFKRGWQCPVLWPETSFIDAFARAGLEMVSRLDLSSDVRPRPNLRNALLTACNRLAALVPSPGWRQVLASHAGGLALERLIRRGEVRYRLLIARRPELRVS